MVEAIRKQHEAMSRAIMLAGERPQSRDTSTKLVSVEKKVIGLESERGVLKQMLTTTQKERDELMKEVHRLHSQGTLFIKTFTPLKYVKHFLFTSFRINFDERDSISGLWKPIIESS